MISVSHAAMFFALTLTNSAYAGQVDLKGTVESEHLASADCSKALVSATVDSNNIEISRLSLAYNLSKDSYEEVKNNAGAKGEYQGIPIGANYDEFRKNVNTTAESLKIDHFQFKAASYMTSSLDPKSLQAYKECISARAGLSLFVEQMSKTFLTVRIVYNPSPNEPQAVSHLIQVDNISDAERIKLERQINTSTGPLDEVVPIRVDSISSETVIQFTVGHISRTIIVPALNQPIVQRRFVENPTLFGFMVSAHAGDKPRDSIQACLTPTHKNGILVKGTSLFRRTASGSDLGGASSVVLIEDTPTEICYTVSASFVGGFSWAEIKGYVGADEEWVEP